MNNFIIDSNEHCFICLTKCGPEATNSNKTTIYSIEDLSRYLKVNRRKVFNEKAPIPPPLLAKVEGSELKGRLCHECQLNNERLSNVINKNINLDDKKESIMDVARSVPYLLTIQMKMTNAAETGLTKSFRKSMSLSHSRQAVINGKEKLDMVEALRTEFMQKCSLVLRRFLPQVNLTRLITDTGGVGSTPKHLQPLHDAAGKKFECDVCGIRFNQAGLLRFHQQTVNCGKELKGMAATEKPRPSHRKPTLNEKHSCRCQHCGQGFTKTCNLLKHIQHVHLGIRKYPCDRCEKRFKTPLHRENHLKTVHLKLREFGCGLCGKKFGRRSNLDKHVHMVHDKPRPLEFQCQKCEQKFSGQGQLTRHLRLYTKRCIERAAHVEKPRYRINPQSGKYQCDLCSKELSSESYARDHYNVIHLNVVRHECPSCGEKFKYKYILGIHVRNVHGKNQKGRKNASGKAENRKGGA